MSLILKRSLSLTLSVLSTAAASQDKVVYGVDNRLEVYEAPQSLQVVASSTAAMIPNAALKSSVVDGVTVYQTHQGVLQDGGICEDDRFAKQPNPGMCSGFLVGPDLLVTAGHCVNRSTSCESNAWVFDFKVEAGSDRAGTKVLAKDVYKCKQIINVVLNNFSKADYALIQLERVASDRTPLKFRSEEKVSDGQGIVVIGHPMGLPTKVADGANVRDNDHPEYFTANLDTFGGNSGSAVFNMNDLTVEGILVRGETDYVYNDDKGCQEVYKCDDDKCRGEDVSRITSILELAMRDKVLAAAESGDKATIEAYLAKKGWVDIYDNARESLLIKATKAQSSEIAKLLLKVRADVALTDLNGKVALHHLADAATTSEAGAEILKALSEKSGFNVDARDNAGETALIKAVKNNNTKLVELLLNLGADALLTDKAGKTALSYTRPFNLSHFKMRRLLKRALAKN